tara:strand:+ start:221 stop:595 length:375 start_codon:yes stop_codon:yes gene_type:complete
MDKRKLAVTIVSYFLMLSVIYLTYKYFEVNPQTTLSLTALLSLTAVIFGVKLYSPKVYSVVPVISYLALILILAFGVLSLYLGLAVSLFILVDAFYAVAIATALHLVYILKVFKLNTQGQQATN